jgi:hypothetical protein
MIIALALCAVFLGPPLCGQDAGELDILLETSQVSGSRAARFVLASAGLLEPGLSGQAAEEAAWNAALERGWVRGSSSSALRLKEAAYLVMAAFGLKGGLMYSLFPGPRYAYRELLRLRLIQGRADENFTLSGERLLHILGRVMQYAGEDRRLEAELPAAPGAQGTREVPAGQGLSSGPERALPYEEGFILE